jgi:hypothetical protein
MIQPTTTITRTMPPITDAIMTAIDVWVCELLVDLPASGASPPLLVVADGERMVRISALAFASHFLW